MKKKNNAVEFWRFIMTFGVVAAHVNRYYRDTETVIFAGSGQVMILFLVLMGYFLYQGFQSKKLKGEHKDKSASKIAVDYLGNRCIRLLPVLIISVLLCFFIRSAFINGTPISEWPKLLINSTFEFFGLSMTGINWTGDSALWFPAGWYISSAIIAGYFMTYLLAKNEDKFIGFIAPLTAIIVFGWSSITGNGFRWMNSFYDLGLFAPIYVFAGMSIGVIIWKLVNSLSKIEFSKGLKIGLTVVHTALAAFLLVNLLGTKLVFNDYIMYFWITIETIIVLLNKDYLTKLMNNKLTGALGGLTIYMYGGHRAWAFFFPAKFAGMGYYSIMTCVVVSTIVTAILMKILCEKGIIPLINKITEKAKKNKIAE